MATTQPEDVVMGESLPQTHEPIMITSDTNTSKAQDSKSRSSSPELTDALEAMLGGITHPHLPTTKSNAEDAVTKPIETPVQPDLSLSHAVRGSSEENNGTVEDVERTASSTQQTQLQKADAEPAHEQSSTLETPATEVTSEIQENESTSSVQHIMEQEVTEHNVVSAKPQEDVKMTEEDEPAQPIILPSGKLYTPNITSAPGHTRDDENFVIRPDHVGSDNEGDGHPEWEDDSSPYESSSDSSDDSEDEAGAQKDQPLLSPKAQAKQLMDAIKNAEPLADASSESSSDSDDDADNDKVEMMSEEEDGPVGKGQILRTKNEQKEVIIPKPDIVVTAEMNIVALGKVEYIVDSTIVVPAYISGQQRVVDTGSALCLSDRSVIGAIADVVGNVKTPVYSVLFTNREAITAANIDIGTEIFFIESHATYALTKTLYSKGTDASNLYDEEVDENEMEFSDDEEEAEHKRRLKLAKQNRNKDPSDLNGFSPKDQNGRGGMRGNPRGRATNRGARGGRHGHERAPYPPPQQQVATLNYDDEEDGPYRPLSRPASLANPGAPQEPPQEQSQSNNHIQFSRGRGDRNDRGRGNQRGDRNHAKNDRGRGRDRNFGRGGGRGDHSQQHGSPSHNSRPGSSHSHHGPASNFTTPQPQFGQGQNNQFPPRLPVVASFAPLPPPFPQGPALPGQAPTWPQFPPPPPVPPQGAQLQNFYQDPRVQQALQLLQSVQQNQGPSNPGYPQQPPLPPGGIPGLGNHNQNQFQTPQQQNWGYQNNNQNSQNNQSNHNGYYGGGNNNQRGGYDYRGRG